MDKQTVGTVIAVTKQWWLKVNTKAVRFGPADGAVFPHVIKVEYVVDGTVYTKRKWVNAGKTVPNVGNSITVAYDSAKPSRAKVLWAESQVR